MPSKALNKKSKKTLTPIVFNKFEYCFGTDQIVIMQISLNIQQNLNVL